MNELYKRKLDEFLRVLHECEDPRGRRVVDLADRIGVTRKTVYAYRDKAKDIYDIWIDDHESNPDIPRGYLKMADGAPELRDVTLSRAEIEALVAAAARLEPLTPLIKGAIGKLTEGRRLERSVVAEPVLYTPLSDEYPPELYERVTKAIRSRRTVMITYRNAKGEEKSYKFDPYILIARDPHLYLIGANHNSREAGFDCIHDLRLDQIQAVTLLREYFKAPDFDVAEYCRSRFRAFSGDGPVQTVRVRFSPEKAGFIRRTRRHPSQVVHDRPDGCVVWQVEVPLSEDLVHWITSYGPHAKVLEPDALRERVVMWAKGTIEANGSRSHPPHSC